MYVPNWARRPVIVLFGTGCVESVPALFTESPMPGRVRVWIMAPLSAVPHEACVVFFCTYLLRAVNRHGDAVVAVT